MTAVKSTNSLIDQMYGKLKMQVDAYEKLPTLEKIPPITNPEVEAIRWRIEELIGFLYDEDTHQLLGDEKFKVVDRAYEIMTEIKDGIRRTWNASDRG